MKKSLIALAVLGLSGTAAMAQSSVTLYGVADAGLVRTDPFASAGDNSKSAEFGSGGMMNAYTSRLGVKGTEDIGNGNSVIFNFETGINLGNGNNLTAYGSSTSAFWGRQANIAIGGGWGTVKMGRQFTPSFLVSTTYDLTHSANWSVVGNTYNYLMVVNTNNTTLGVARADQAFAYVTPTFSGLTAAIAYVTKQDMLQSYGVKRDGYDLGVLYANGPISGGVSVNQIAGSKTNWQVGGQYKFGTQFALAASYNSASTASPTGSSGSARRQGWELGGSAFFGPFTATVDFARDTKNQWFVDQSSGTFKKYTNGVLDLRYALSKRTFLYGAYLRKNSTNNYGFGIDHNF